MEEDVVRPPPYQIAAQEATAPGRIRGWINIVGRPVTDRKNGGKKRHAVQQTKNVN